LLYQYLLIVQFALINIVAVGLFGLPPLTGSKCLARETGHLGPRKNGDKQMLKKRFSVEQLTSKEPKKVWLSPRQEVPNSVVLKN
jgi:hypothetical protein